MAESRPALPPEDAATVGATRVVATGDQLVLERKSEGCLWLFLLLTLTFGGIPLMILVISLANNTLFAPAVLKALLVLGVPAGFVIWYLLADMFNRQILTCDRHKLHRRDTPIWFFNSPVTIPVIDIKKLSIHQFERFDTNGGRHLHYQLYVQLQSDRYVKFSFSTTNYAEIEFVYHQLQAYLPATVD
jgi:hypothetical protein